MGGAPVTCPMCLAKVEAAPHPCTRCGSVYHAGCWPGAGCVVPGCGRPLDRPRTPAEPVPWHHTWQRWSLLAAFATLTGAYLRNDGAHPVPGELLVCAVLTACGSLALSVILGACYEISNGTGAASLYGNRAAMLVTFGSLSAPLIGGFGSAGLGLGVLALGIGWCGGTMCALSGVIVDRRRVPAAAVLFLEAAVLSTVVFAARDTRIQANTRACYANQKTIAGAMEMYNLDKNTRRTALDGMFFMQLKSGGYLQAIPQDPGAGAGSSGSYKDTGTGNGVRCVTHGSIQ